MSFLLLVSVHLNIFLQQAFSHERVFLQQIDKVYAVNIIAFISQQPWRSPSILSQDGNLTVIPGNIFNRKLYYLKHRPVLWYTLIKDKRKPCRLVISGKILIAT